MALPSGAADSHRLLARRVALYGAVSFWLALGFFVCLNVIYQLHDVAAVDEHSKVNLLHGAALLVAGGVWLAAKRRPLSSAMLVGLEAAATFASSALFAAMANTLPSDALPQYVAALAVLHVLVGRVMIVPSSPRGTLAVGVVSSLPVLAVAFVHYRGAELAAGASPRVLFAFAVAWQLLAVATTTTASAVVYGLRRTATRAMQLGQYTLVDKIGAGGMGVVYRATHAMLRRPTAVKLLPLEHQAEIDIARFEREVRLTSLLSHPNTIVVYDYGRTPEGVFYYAMELLDGVTLARLVEEEGPQCPARVIHVLRQVCGALAEAHQVGLVHRDIKPANIMLCERGGVPDVAKVLDFGLVKEMKPVDGEAVTGVNTIAGTPQYLSPEAIRGSDALDARSDLYALGAVGYYLLAGRDVFEANTLVELLSLHLTQQPERPSAKLGEGLPPILEDVVLRCLEKDPAKRWSSARELDEALAACERRSDVGQWTTAEGIAWWRGPGPRLCRRVTAAERSPATEADPALAATIIARH